jgi:hypothetical protein
MVLQLVRAERAQHDGERQQESRDGAPVHGSLKARKK